jgi:PleD family two-component response regulator
MSRPPLILIVEDNFANQLVTMSLLEPEGYEGDLAVTPIEALERLRTRAPDLILMDIQLPRQDGLCARSDFGRADDNSSGARLGCSSTADEAAAMRSKDSTPPR